MLLHYPGADMPRGLFTPGPVTMSFSAKQQTCAVCLPADLHFRNPQSRVCALRIWNYFWRLWTIPEAKELLLAVGFDAVHTWLRPIRQTGTSKVRRTISRASARSLVTNAPSSH